MRCSICGSSAGFASFDNAGQNDEDKSPTITSIAAMPKCLIKEVSVRLCGSLCLCGKRSVHHRDTEVTQSFTEIGPFRSEFIDSIASLTAESYCSKHPR